MTITPVKLKTKATRVTKEGKPRLRREKLSPHIRRIEHNVFMHIKREVRHTGAAWQPLMLDPAWDAAVKRMVKDGILVESPTVGGYVPAEWIAGMQKEQDKLLGEIKSKAKKAKAVVFSNLTREEAQAAARLVKTGQLQFDPKTASYSL